VAKALKINPRDNVAVLLADIRSGETVDAATGAEVIHIQARQEIAFGHKIALANLAADQRLRRLRRISGRSGSLSFRLRRPRRGGGYGSCRVRLSGGRLHDRPRNADRIPRRAGDRDHRKPRDL